MNKHAVTGLLGAGIGSGIAYFWGQPTATATTTTTSVPGLANGGTIGLTGNNVNPSAFFQYGFPGPIHDLQNKQAFVSCYDRRTRNPYWVVEHFTKESLATKSGDRKNSVFKEDESLPEMFKAKLKDYFRSGYDRGHMVPAADCKWDQSAMDETFFMTNISPQVGDGFNRDYWAHLEDFCRRLAKDKYPSVRVVTGPLFLPKQCPDGKFRVTYEVIGNPANVAVPTHFYKLIVAENNTDSVAVAAFVLPNDVIPNSVPLSNFEVPLDALERSAGLQFLQKVPNNKRRSLCRETKCEIIVRDFTKALPAPSLPK